MFWGYTGEIISWTALEMLKDNMELEKIVRYSRLPMDQILLLGKNISYCDEGILQ